MRTKMSIALLLLTAATPALAVDLQNLAGCFSVTYRFVENGPNDYGPVTVTERIAMSQRDGGMAFEHHQVVGASSFFHYSETWTQEADGQWKQVVTNPNGELRYECTSPFFFNQWRCSDTGAPKPRRDQARQDYETIDRDLGVQITPMGWVQTETNVKRAADGSAVSNEVGWIEYKRLDDASCPQIAR